MRILLLSCNTGGGHNSAAVAISDHCVRRGIECDLHDALLFVSRSHTKIASNGHTYVYRHFPRLFGIGYRYEEKHQPRFFYNQMAWGAKKFAAFLEENHYDAVVSTHVFGNMLVTEARRKYGVTIPHYSVNTDYTLCPGVDMVDARIYFIAAEELRQTHLCAGFPDEKVVTSGIPIRETFFDTFSKQDSRSRLNLPKDKKIILMFSGSIGCGKLHRKAPLLEKQLPTDAHLTIICGNNKQLYKRLTRSCGSNTTVVGFTDQVADYMAAADLCITKPGGLSTTELSVMGVPMVLMLSVPGCETHNLEHFEKLDVAVGTEDWDEAIRLACDLIDDNARLDEMRNRLNRIGYPGGAKVVINHVLADLAKQE